MDIVPRNLTIATNGRMPEMLGSFHLDDHNVQEWSDASQPGWNHRARKEIGKWVDPDKNADIKFQRREDSKQSEKSREQQRTEVIQGNAPDAAFQIIRSQRQFQDSDEHSGSRISTVSTSYQMTTSHGVRSTSKTTSNKTTTKTVTVSGGRSDDFENLKMSFQPLDTSTQRERINVSRSGTMGVRRPPTRRHTPAAILSSVPFEFEAEPPTIVALDEDPDEPVTIPEYNRNEDPPDISILGYKNISPKIRVGFPVEIQLELQSKLRYSNGEAEEQKDDFSAQVDNQDDIDTDTIIKSRPTTPSKFLDSNKVIPSMKSSSSATQSKMTTSTAFRSKMQAELMNTDESEHPSELIDANESADSLFQPLTEPSNDDDLTFDFGQRRKSYGFESFDEPNLKRHEEPNAPEDNVYRHLSNSNTSSVSNIYARANESNGLNDRRTSNLSRLSPSSLSRSWDLIQSVANAQQRREANKKLFSSSSKLDDLSSIPTSNSHKVPQKSVVMLNTYAENDAEDSDISGLNLDSCTDYKLDSLDIFPRSPKKFPNSASNRRPSTTVVNIERSPNESSPDVIHNSNEKVTPPSENPRERKIMDEKPDLLNKMSFKNYFPSSNGDLLEIQPLKSPDTDNLPSPQNEFKSNLDYLNESLSRILNEDSKFKSMYNKDKKNSYVGSNYSYGKPESRTKTLRGDQMLIDSYADDDTLDNSIKGSKQTQVSHTWISSLDQKPSQHARDNDVTTSISATRDPFKRAPRKVEFSKTEVHFTPDSGKFNIVETDENKPSTVHLFRRKKKEKKSSSTNSILTTSSETKKTSEFSEKHNKIQNRSEQEQKPHNQTQARTFARSNASGDEDPEGLELVKKSEMVDKVGVERNKTSMFDRWTEQDAKPELGVDEEIVTPATTTANISISSLNSNRDPPDRQSELNTNDEEQFLGSNESLLSSKLPPGTTDFNALLPTEVLIGSKAHVRNHNNHSLSSVNTVNNRSAVMTELFGEISNDGDEADDMRPDTVLCNYGELKIQRYLKQLKPPSSHAGSDSSVDILQLDADQDQQVDEESLNHFRFDNVYENGSFVPLATRKSLIEMNNRNRKRGSNCHLSDNSSTTSNYSLPHSDRESMSKGDYHLPLKLTMEATVDTKGEKPQITTVDLNYSFNTNNSYFSEPVKRNFKISKLEPDSHDALYETVPPVKPEVRSLPPLNKNSRVSISSNQANLYPSKGPVGESTTAFKHSKPPTPILPSQFSNFEKSGAALRERFNAKNSGSAMFPREDFSENQNKSTEPRISDELYSPVDSEPAYTPSKSVVNIGPDNNLTSNTMNDVTSDNLATSPLPEDQYDDMGENLINELNSQEPILSMDHTWKGPAHFESQSKDRGAPVMRSMTFPKSSRPEPEWIAKAKSRESRVTDWNLVGKQYGTTRKSEPPWITEIRFKSKPPRSEETKSLPKTSNVYPWQKEIRVPVEREIIPVRIRSPSPVENTNVENKRQTNGSVTIEEICDDASDITEFPAKRAASPCNVPVLPKRNLDSSRDMNHTILNHAHMSGKVGRRSPKEMSLNDTESDTYNAKNIISDHSITSEVSDTSLDRKLLAPLTESTKRTSRKPLQSLSTANKNITDKNTQNVKPSAPPRPPKPPQRISSLGNKSQPLSVPVHEKKSSPHKQKHHTQNIEKHHTQNIEKHHTQNIEKHHTPNNSSVTSDSLLSTRSAPTIHTHPLVKVAKIPPAKSLSSKSPSPTDGKGTVSKNKAKHHVVTNETKLMCKSKLLDGAKDRETESHHTNGSSPRPPPKVPPQRTATIAPPHRKR